MRIILYPAYLLVFLPLATLLALPAMAAEHLALRPFSEQLTAGGKAEQVSFQRHVLPLLGRLGCNGRACHGSFQGQGGFRLSLFGYDYRADHQALTRSEPPRVDVASPAQSLILNKPTSEDDHEGGQRFQKDGWEYRVLRRWIETGAENDQYRFGYLERLEVSPREIVFHEDGARTRLRAVAHWSTGLVEDVTPLCRFLSNDSSVARVSKTGLVEPAGSGDTHVVVLYEQGMTTVPVLKSVSPQLVRNYPLVPTPTRIDELVVAKLRKLGIAPSELSSDEEFLRRVSLDITGTLPLPEEVELFLADRSADKRTRKIDQLLERPAYAAWWTTRLCDLTGNNPLHSSRTALRSQESRHWYDWIYRRVQDNVPYDELVAGIVLADSRHPDESFADYCAQMTRYYRRDQPASFAERESMPHYWSRRNVRRAQDKALSFSYSFLAVRLECAQCHKHPFDLWTQADFQQFTTFFRAIRYGTRRGDRQEFERMRKSVLQEEKQNGKKGRNLAQIAKAGKTVPWTEVFVSVSANRKRRGKSKSKASATLPVGAKLLGGKTVWLRYGDDPRIALMDWLRGKDNPYFARAFVNRVWANYFHVGIIDPPDDISRANPPSNGPLLDYLAEEFIAHDWDMKWLHRTITRSRTYQLSWRPNDTNQKDKRNFSRSIPRRLPAEVVFDAVRQATANDEQVEKMQRNVTRRAIGHHSDFYLSRSKGYALVAFGMPDRSTNCDCQRSRDPSLLQTLFLRNDHEILRLIRSRDGWLQQIVSKEKGSAKLLATQSPQWIYEAYLRTLSRPPTEAESRRAQDHLRQSKNIRRGMSDILWALINTKEFVVNH